MESAERTRAESKGWDLVHEGSFPVSAAEVAASVDIELAGMSAVACSD